MSASAAFTYLCWSPFIAAAVIVPLEAITGHTVGELYDRLRWRCDERRARGDLHRIAEREATLQILDFMVEHGPYAPNPRLREVHGSWFAYDRRLAQLRREGWDG